MDAELTARLTAALEALANANRPSQSRASILIKEISYIKEFDGNKNHLTQFLNIVNNHLNSITDETTKEEVWLLIYNCKIVGKAKELLINNHPQNWQEAENLLKQHFRPTTNYKDIARRINSLRVNSVADLNCKIEEITLEINTFSTYQTNSAQTRDCFYTLLINQIKQIVTGNLSREIKDMFNLHSIKDVLYSYIGYDHHNIDKDYLCHDKKQLPSKPKNPFTPNHNTQNNYNNHHYNRHRPNSTQFGQNNNFPQQQFRTGSGQVRQQVFNPSGQIRNSFQRPEPMEIGQLAHGNPPEIDKVEEVHNIDPAFFLN